MKPLTCLSLIILALILGSGDIISKNSNESEKHNDLDFKKRSNINSIKLHQPEVYTETFSDISSAADSISLLINSDLSLVNGNVPGWKLKKSNESIAEYSTDEKNENILVIKNMYYDRFFQKVSLPKGHYILRALVKTNVSQIYAYSNVKSAEGNYPFRIPVPISNEFNWVELPFYVTAPKSQEKTDVEVGLLYSGLSGGTGAAARYTIDLYTKKIELIRLGNTSIPHSWELTIPADSIHGLETLHKVSDWDRPGKVIFKDSFLGTEIWLMSQGGQTDMSYAGFPDFSNDGKYMQTGFRRPGHVVRTDGSYRYYPNNDGTNEKWTYKILWPFPWEEKRIPEGTSKSDWVVTSRDINSMKMLNLATDQKHEISMPSRTGWQIIHYPSATVHANRGPALSRITYETLVWQSKDRKSIGLSDVEGNHFRSFRIKSISTKPENDVVHPTGMKDQPIIPLVGGKGGDNWRNAIDRYGNRYFVFEINRENASDDPSNPYQLWAISLIDGDARGLLRIVPYPGVDRTHHNDNREYKLKWWEFAAGFPQSGDNAIFMLEDNTLIHMSSLGMHSGFAGTISTTNPYENEVKFIANYPKNTWSADRISWPHEFKHDRDFAVLEAVTDAAPYGPLVMIDLKHQSIWTLVLTNYHDYSLRYWQRPMYKDRPGYIEYHKPMFRHTPTPSPDFTKVVYCSSMLTGNDPEKLWGDAYIAVAHYPQPPVNVRLDGKSLVWERPYYSKEIMGFNIYRSDESGKGEYEKINKQPIKETRYALQSQKDQKDQKDGFFVLTSVEHSGLESRNFSNEVTAGKNKIFRKFYQSEEGEITIPMVPFFEPQKASNSYAVAITDPELIYSKQLDEGLEGSLKIDIDIPTKGKWRIMARVRGMSGIERSTYTTGWAPSGEPAKGSFKVRINGNSAGNINVDGFNWEWIELDKSAIKLSRGRKTLEFSTSTAGIAIDNILVTNDPVFIPDHHDNTPAVAPSVPSELKIAELNVEEKSTPLEWQGYTIKSPYVKLSWKPSTALQGVRYYSIYRSNVRNFTPSPATLIGSTSETFFTDPKFKKGMEYFYQVVAVDNWDNHSLPSKELPVYVK